MCAYVCVIQTYEITQHEQFKNSSKFDVNITHKTMPNLQEITRVNGARVTPPKSAKKKTLGLFKCRRSRHAWRPNITYPGVMHIEI